MGGNDTTNQHKRAFFCRRIEEEIGSCINEEEFSRGLAQTTRNFSQRTELLAVILILFSFDYSIHSTAKGAGKEGREGIRSKGKLI